MERKKKNQQSFLKIYYIYDKNDIKIFLKWLIIGYQLTLMPYL